MKVFIMYKKPNIFLISLIISVFLSSNPAYSSNASLRVPSAFQDKTQNLPVKFREAANLVRAESGYNFDIKRDVFWRLFQDIDGLMICPIAETLAAKGIFTEDLFGEPSDPRWAAIKDIAKRYKKIEKEEKFHTEQNLGYIYGAFRSLALQGWIKMDSKDRDTEVMLTQEGWAAIAIVKSGYYRESVEAIRYMKDYYSYLRRGPLDKKNEEALSEFKILLEKIRKYTSLVRRLKEKNIDNRESLVEILKQELDTEDAHKIITAIENIPHSVKIHVIQRALVHIHSYLIGMQMSPAMAALGMPLFEEKGHAIDEVDADVFKLFKSGDIRLNELDEKKYNSEWLKALLELLETQGIVEIDKKAVRVTRLGKEFIKRVSSYGVTTAYLPSCEILEEMLFGGASLGISEDSHVNRVMDIWGSSGAHRAYLGEYSKETGEITKDGIYSIIRYQFHEIPLDEQAVGFFTMGAGDAHLVADSIRYILRYTERGAHLDTHPLIIVSSDYSKISLARERSTLKEFKNVNGLHIVVMRGDVTDDDRFNRDLNAELGKLDVRRLNTGTGNFEKVDMGAYNASDFVHTEEFIPHERSLRVRDEAEAVRIISDAIEHTDREALKEALKALGVEEVPEDKDELLELVIAQWQGAYVDSLDKGRLVSGYVVAADLIEFMKRWAKYAKHGIRILELHTPRANEQYEEVPADIRQEMLTEKTLSAAYWSTHWMSNQYIMPYPEYNLAMVLSGLRPQKTYLYPAVKTGMPAGVSLALYQKNDNDKVINVSDILNSWKKVIYPAEISL